MSPLASRSDVVIAGAGVAGATLALALKRVLGEGLAVTLADPALADAADQPRSFRAVAVAPDVRRFLDSLGVWTALADRSQPIRSMVITDSRQGAQPNPVFLTFDGGADLGADEPLAHMVLADDLKRHVQQACREAGVALIPTRVTDFVTTPQSLSLLFSDGRRQAARLLVGADGARSRLRHVARIQTLGTSYPQAAIVATLHHDREHAGRAVQHFLPPGPIALLPLQADDGSGRRTSIVWTERRSQAESLTQLSPEDFVAAFEERVGLRLGVTILEDRPKAYPLDLVLARRLTASRFALVGDAARAIHPLAGQGLNLGLRDARALAHRIVERAALGLDPGTRPVLDGYEQDRGFESTAMAAATDALNRLFSNDRVSIRALRDIGLGLVDRSPALKRRFVNQAAGAVTRAR